MATATPSCDQTCGLCYFGELWFRRDKSAQMSFILPKLTTKKEIDDVIRTTEDLVLVLRFGRDDDTTCLRIDDIVRSRVQISL